MPPAEGQNQNQNQENKEKKDTKDQKKKWEPPLPTRVGRKKKKRGPDAASKLPAVFPTTRCRLKLLKMERIKDYLLLEEEFVQNQERLKPEATREEKNEEDRTKVDDLRGTPMAVGTLEEIIDDDHAIISTASGPEFYVSIMSFVDKDLLEPNCQVLLHHKTQGIVGVLADDADPMVSVMKLDKAPTESYADIGGLEQQIQEIKVCCVAQFFYMTIYHCYRNLSSCLLPTPNFMRRWVSSHRRVLSCTVYLGQGRPCWRKPLQTKHLRRSFALSDQS
jgi:26S proteasome regulatory subunit T2